MSLILLFYISLVFWLMGNFGGREVLAGKSFSGGYYTNLCGRGTTADYIGAPCTGDCNPDTGFCGNDGSSNNVFKFTCEGNRIECNSGETQTSGAYVQSPFPGCGKTVQVDVFDHNCRDSGWSCNGNVPDDMRSYMVWYSGDCAPAPTSLPNSGDSKSASQGIVIATFFLIMAAGGFFVLKKT